MTNNEVYGLSRPRISNYTKDPAGKFDGFTLTLDRVFSRGRHATTGSTSLVTSGAFSESGNYYINAKSKSEKSLQFINQSWVQTEVQLQHAVGTGDRTISVASVRTWFDGYGNKRMARTVNDYLSTHAPAAIAANQEFVLAEIDKVVKSWNDSRIKV